MKGIFICGTDTGVGKTRLTASIAKFLYLNNVSVGVMKPVQTGFSMDNLKDSDVAILMEASGIKGNPLDYCVYSFKPPISPHLAAELANIAIDPKKILIKIQQVAANFDILLIEGIGGLYVPLNMSYFLIDLIQELKIPSILVSKLGLGAINHSLLSINALKQKNIPLAGVIFVDLLNRKKDLPEYDNPTVIAKLAQVPVFGVFEHIKPQTPMEEFIAQGAENIKKLPYLVQFLSDYLKADLCKKQEV